ncbi:unnamed protein product [Orchesella dallaii]|uniref:C2H2-type domain-containing protein n=1 Tax=Orchesella dallaii TaxID=48710 RepID=A0ABP1S2B2_9HEXA
MVAVKMFWDMWKNLTSATTNWSFTGNGAKKGLPTSKSSQRTRYNRLRSGPTKSYSQPANLISLASSSSCESLAATAAASALTTAAPIASGQGSSTSCFSFSPKGNSNQGNKEGKKWNGGKAMKHSISSSFPFTSSSTTMTLPNSPETSTPGKSPSTTVDQQQNKLKESSLFSNNASSPRFFSSSNGNALATGGNGNRSNAKKSNVDSGRIGNNMTDPSSTPSTTAATPAGDAYPSWDKARKDAENDFCEDDISDLDDDVEHLTCDVCDRAFPTLKQLADHQRKKRHYGCLQCDSIFPSREVLEYHREQMCHYDYAIDVYEEEGSDSDTFESDDDENGIGDTDDCDDEERERLL